MVVTTITVEGAVRDRLKAYAVGNYSETLTWLMDHVDKDVFVREFRRLVDDPATEWETIDWDDPVWD